MALFRFAKAISEGKPIDVFNNGRMRWSFTHVDDIVEGVARVLDKAPTPKPSAGTDMPIRTPAPPPVSTVQYRQQLVGRVDALH